MEILTAFAEFIPTLGFPIVCVLGLGWFIYTIYQDSKKEKEQLAAQNAENMEKVQIRCQEREDKLYDFMIEQQSINAGFANIIDKYNIKLEEIREDVSIIKTDIEILKNK